MNADRKVVFAIASAAMLLPVTAKAGSRRDAHVVGNVRIQFLSPTLVRLEQKGPKGFEDRNTFTIVRRPRALQDVEERHNGDMQIFARGHVEVDVPASGALKGTTVKLQGTGVYTCDGTAPTPAFFPAPGDMPKAIAIADSPRIVPPKWGAAAPPESNRTRKTTSGWDLSNQAIDIYVFLPDSYNQFRKEFLSLTGPTEMPPLYDFGLWQSRYHPYTEKEALDVIDHYRKDGIPIDNFVVDTDWRVGASHGYAVNTKLFPDMKRFIKEAHSRHVRLMYNDHPEPIADSAVDPKEMAYRENGLASLLKMGADVWWYDRNWNTHLHEPAGLPKEVWGAAIFHDVTQKVNPDRRPLIMSNVPGIDNGLRHYAPHPAAHRYPVWWTGDTRGMFDYLRGGVENAVDGGVESLLPYMSEDLGGHFGNPTTEVYARFMEYGALSPMMRLHCTAGETRDPWAFGPQAESIVRSYAQMRYRLLPTIYSAARKNYEDGTPIVRRCDLEWSAEKDAARSDEYLLGDDLLVAPIMTSMLPEPSVIPSAMFHTPSGKSGLQGDYFGDKDVEGSPLLTRTDPQIDFDWGDGAAAPGVPDDNFSIRWTGKIGPVPVTGDYQFVTVTDDGVRLWVDGKAVIDRFQDMDHQESRGTIHLDAGKSYDVRMEYFDSGGQAAAHLKWITPNIQPKDFATRNVWIPPGQWMDLWSEEVVKGPTIKSVAAPLGEIPMWARAGGMVFLAPAMQYTSERRWDPITIEAFASGEGSCTRTLYEDDGISNDYKKKGFSKTDIQLVRRQGSVQIAIGAAKGAFDGKPADRSWIIRLHLPYNVASYQATENGKALESHIAAKSPSNSTFPFNESDDKLERPCIIIDVPRGPTNKRRIIKVKLNYREG